MKLELLLQSMNAIHVAFCNKIFQYICLCSQLMYCKAWCLFVTVAFKAAVLAVIESSDYIFIISQVYPIGRAISFPVSLFRTCPSDVAGIRFIGRRIFRRPSDLAKDRIWETRYDLPSITQNLLRLGREMLSFQHHFVQSWAFERFGEYFELAVVLQFDCPEPATLGESNSFNLSSLCPLSAFNRFIGVTSLSSHGLVGSCYSPIRMIRSFL